jgi:sugar O-acyltransferase (sialic acid O-acetyltransferase NeuD family)
MKEKLLIIGASGHGKVVADIALKMNKWKYIAFLDDNKEINPSMDIPVIGRSDEILNYIGEYEIIIGIGNNTVRKRFQEMLENEGAKIPILIHPSAVIGNQVKVDNGTVIMAGAIINCCTKIGKGCIVNTSATVDHDSTLADFVHVSPGVHLAGNVNVGKCSWLGIGSIVINNIDITDNCIIGASAVVTQDITLKGTYIGMPAKKILKS